LSKILSGFVLLTWLSYSIINLRRPPDQRGWAHPFIGIILASASIGYLIFLGTQGETLLAKKAVRMFMTCLLWGTFAPLCLERKNFSKPNIILWTTSVVLTAFFALDANIYPYTFWGPLGLGFSLIFSIFRQSSRQTLRLNFYWLCTALSLLLFGLGTLPNQHSIAVAGIHFFILGPILQTLFDFKKYQFRWIYHISLWAMIVSISIPSLAPKLYLISRTITTLSSALLVIWMAVFLIRKEAFSKI
jgi:hypothetical protein